MADNPRTGGSRGRPPRGESKITEGDYPELYQRWLKGVSVLQLAVHYKVDWHTVSYHLQKCRMQVRNTLVRDRNEVLDELSMIRAEAWECFQNSKRSLTTDEINKEVSKIAKKKGVRKAIAGQVIKQTTRVTLRDGEASWLSVAMAAIDIENKLNGHYETGKREGQKPAGSGNYRAAGRSPEEHHEAMAKRLVDVLTQRREALTQGQN